MTNGRAAFLILEAMAKRIKKKLKEGTLNMADVYISNLLAMGHEKIKKERQLEEKK